MKRLLFNTIFICLAVSAWASPKKEYQRTIDRQFSTSKTGEVDVDNMYGKVDILSWDKPEVDIKIVVTVEAESDEVADKVFNMISFDIGQSGNTVSAKTKIDSNGKNCYTGWGKNASYSIDYTVRMPVNNSLNLDNKYGNVFINKLLGRSDINLKYGNLKADELQGATDMRLSYGNANIGLLNAAELDFAYMTDVEIESVNTLELDASYSKVEIEDLGIAEVDSKYGKLEIGKAVEIDIDGMYDKYTLDKVHDIVVDARYSTLIIDDLMQSLDVELNYGKVDIDNVAPNFTKISVDLAYAGIDMPIEHLDNYILDAEASYGSIDLPSEFRGAVDKDSTEEAARVTKGNANRQIIIEVGYGSIDLD